MKKIVLLSLLLVGCSLTPGELYDRAASVQYMRDSRTNLCFAVNPNNGSMTNVPCTPEVEKLLFH